MSEDGPTLFELILFLISSARTGLDEVPRYNAFRMLQAVQRATKLDEAKKDAFLQGLSQFITDNNQILMKGSPLEFKNVLDELVSRMAKEMKRRT